MRTKATVFVVLGLVFLLASNKSAAQFISGSTGADGALNVTSATTMNVPEPDGIFNFTTINISSGATVSFIPNRLNTPVYMLATGDVTIDGTIDVRGKSGSGNPPVGGGGGPGGYPGGSAGTFGALAGDGQGPGAGKRGNGSSTSGRGAYATNPGGGDRAADGTPYGSPLLVPLVGGSGAGGYDGSPGDGGGGGGGAVLVASDTQITIGGSGVIELSGGGSSSTAGSAGADRLVAPIVRGTGSIRNQSVSGFGGAGRVRVDTIDRSELAFAVQVSSVYSVGGFMRVFPDPLPRLDIVHAAGKDIPEGTTEAVSVFLPLNSPTQQRVTVQGRDFTGMVPIRVVLTPDSGSSVVEDATLDMSTNPATVDLMMDFPVNTPSAVNAFTK